MTILHLALRTDWLAAQRGGQYRVSTLGRSLDDVGFIHASYSHQLATVAETFYTSAGDALCVLVMDEETIRESGTPVVVEDGGSGEEFPHIYGPIDPAWVTDVRPGRFDEDGRFQFWSARHAS